MKFKKYLIKQGEHYPKGFHLGITFRPSIIFEAYFDANCLYDLKGGDNYGINKLYGFTATYYQHKQSARFGWRCLDGKNIQIVTYTYNQETDILGTVKPQELFTCGIVDLEESYLYAFKKESKSSESFYHNAKQILVSGKPDWFLFHYKLFPYFGGNQPAPHNMNIYIKNITQYNKNI